MLQLMTRPAEAWESTENELGIDGFSTTSPLASEAPKLTLATPPSATSTKLDYLGAYRMAEGKMTLRFQSTRRFSEGRDAKQVQFVAPLQGASQVVFSSWMTPALSKENMRVKWQFASTWLRSRFATVAPALNGKLVSDLTRQFEFISQAIFDEWEDIEEAWTERESGIPITTAALQSLITFIKRPDIRTAPALTLTLDGGVSASWFNTPKGKITALFRPRGNMRLLYVEDSERGIRVHATDMDSGTIQSQALPDDMVL